MGIWNRIVGDLLGFSEIIDGAPLVLDLEIQDTLTFTEIFDSGIQIEPIEQNLSFSETLQVNHPLIELEVQNTLIFYQVIRKGIHFREIFETLSIYQIIGTVNDFKLIQNTLNFQEEISSFLASPVNEILNFSELIETNLIRSRLIEDQLELNSTVAPYLRTEHFAGIEITLPPWKEESCD